MTATQLAREILASKVSLSANRHDLSRQVQEYIQDNYVNALSRVRARTGVGLEADGKDEQRMSELQPYLTNVYPVVTAIEQIVMGQDPDNPFSALSQPQPKRPEEMTQDEYHRWRASGNAPFKTSQGILG